MVSLTGDRSDYVDFLMQCLPQKKAAVLLFLFLVDRGRQIMVDPRFVLERPQRSKREIPGNLRI